MYLIHIIQDLEEPTHYKIGYSTTKGKQYGILEKGNRHLMKLIFELEITDDVSILSIERIIHDYLKEKGYWISGDWFNIPDDNEIVTIVKSIIPFSKKSNKIKEKISI